MLWGVLKCREALLRPEVASAPGGLAAFLNLATCRDIRHELWEEAGVREEQGHRHLHHSSELGGVW